MVDREESMEFESGGGIRSGDAIGTFEFPARAMARPFFLAWIQQNKFHLFILYLEFRFGGEYDFLPMDVVEEDLRVSFPENSREFSN